MKTIEMKMVYRDDDDKWEDRDGNAISVVLDDSHPVLHALSIDGVQHLVFNMEPYVCWGSYGINIGYQCFKPSPGVSYMVFLDGKQDCGAYEIVEEYRRNGFIIVGTDLKSHPANA